MDLFAILDLIIIFLLIVIVGLFIFLLPTALYDRIRSARKSNEADLTTEYNRKDIIVIDGQIYDPNTLKRKDQ